MSFELSIILIMALMILYIMLFNFFSVLFVISGIPKKRAKFQAISLFTNCGFTTTESEIITNNKATRKIALACMITGNLFSVLIVSLIVNMLTTLSKFNETGTYTTIFISFLIFIAILLIFNIPFVKKAIEKLFSILAENIVNHKGKDNRITILDYFGNNSVVEVKIRTMPNSLKDKTIHESGLKKNYDINLLSIKRNNRTISITRNTLLQNNDTILLFGNFDYIRDIFTNNLSEESTTNIKNSHINHIDLIDNYGNNALVEVTINNLPSILKDKTIFESKIKENFGLNIMIVKRDNEAIEVSKDTIIKKHDNIVLYGNFEIIKSLFLTL